MILPNSGVAKKNWWLFYYDDNDDTEADTMMDVVYEVGSDDD